MLTYRVRSLLCVYSSLGFSSVLYYWSLLAEAYDNKFDIILNI